MSTASNIAKSYAKAMYELALELKIDIADEMIQFNNLINSNNQFETFLFLEVFTIEEKTTVVNEIIDKVKLSNLFKNFINYLLLEKRIGQLPMIFKEIIVIDDDKKGFMRGTIEGSSKEMDSKTKEQLSNYLKKQLNKEIKLDYKINNDISAGYKVTVGDFQLDASVESQLEKLKREILNS